MRQWLVALLAVMVVRVGAAPADPAALAERLDQANTQVEAGKLDEALAAVRAVRAETPVEAPWLLVRALLLEGGIQVRAGHWPEAEAVYAQFMDTYAAAPQAPEAWLQLGRVRQQTGRLEGARQAWERIVAEAPDAMVRLDAEQALIELLISEGKLPAAEQRATTLLAQWPWLQAAPELCATLGQARLEAGQAAEALGWFERARRDYPGSDTAFEVRRPLVEALRQAGRVPEALALLNEVRIEHPEMFVVADAASLTAAILAEQGQTKEAVAALEAVVAAWPGTDVAARALWQAVGLQQAAGEPAAALASFRAHAAEFVGDWWQVRAGQVLLELAAASEAWNDAEDAADAVVTLTDGSPVAAQTLLRKAAVQIEAKRPRGAQVTLEKVIQRYKGAPVVPQAEAMLQSLTAPPG